MEPIWLKAHHRRAHSDTLFNLDSDDLFINLDVSNLDFPSAKPAHHVRSLSLGSDNDFFDNLDFLDKPERSESLEKPPRHRHSSSMDGSVNSMSFQGEIDSMKKSMGADRLAELALIDLKKAKRILANRQSAARSKERKIQYTGELERKVQTLQSEATNLSAQVTILQRDTTGLTAENKELKYKLQAMEQQAHLRDALSEALREEVQRLKIAAGQIPAANGNVFSGALPPQFSSRPPMYQNFGNKQNQQIHMFQSAKNQTLNSQPKPSFMDFNHRIK